jgi:phosphoserine phosphatase
MQVMDCVFCQLLAGKSEASILLHGIAGERIAAVGDSIGDTEMLCAANLRFFVGKTFDPKLSSVVHLADADLRLVSERIIDAWAAQQPVAADRDG